MEENFKTHCLNLSVCPENHYVETSSIDSLYATVNVSYTDKETYDTKIPSNYVIVLDTSGSMEGAKIENVKNSILYVLERLTELDKLCLICFNSDAQILSELLQMTEANKELVRTRLQTLTAGGGTNILAGLQFGFSLLESCDVQGSSSFFFLTDGQDRNNEGEQVEMLKKIQNLGAGLFIFGFGQDHDSVHLTGLANATKAVYAYIETNEYVAGFFGGSIGLQQSSTLKHVRLVIDIHEGVRIKSVKCGAYQVDMAHNSVAVHFPDLKNGEERYVLLRFELTAVPEPVKEYHLFTASLSCDGQKMLPRVCFVERVEPAGLTDSRLLRSLVVDTEIKVYEAENAMQESIMKADNEKYAQAEKVLSVACQKISTHEANSNRRISLKNMNQEIKIKNIVDDLEECKLIVSSKDNYNAGGRALISEICSQINLQRCICAKRGEKGIFQTPISFEAQRVGQKFASLHDQQQNFTNIAAVPIPPCFCETTELQLCYYKPSVMRISHTDKNPDRKYFTCGGKRGKGTNCGFFRWEDKMLEMREKTQQASISQPTPRGQKKKGADLQSSQDDENGNTPCAIEKSNEAVNPMGTQEPNCPDNKKKRTDGKQQTNAKAGRNANKKRKESMDPVVQESQSRSRKKPKGKDAVQKTDDEATSTSVKTTNEKMDCDEPDSNNSKRASRVRTSVKSYAPEDEESEEQSPVPTDDEEDFGL